MSRVFALAVSRVLVVLSVGGAKLSTGDMGGGASTKGCISGMANMRLMRACDGSGKPGGRGKGWSGGCGGGDGWYWLRRAWWSGGTWMVKCVWRLGYGGAAAGAEGGSGGGVEALLGLAAVVVSSKGRHLNSFL